MTPRKKSKTDKNHALIRDGTRLAGYFVADTAALGDGFPDLVIADRAGRVALLWEVKTPGEVNQQIITFTEKEVSFMMQIVDPVYRVGTELQDVINVMRELDGSSIND